uniref:Uncharacterized protein n=1 Tax=Oryza glumipatula TaxID=40148 RepID=A0A0D9ZIB5_9ORYZ
MAKASRLVVNPSSFAQQVRLRWFAYGETLRTQLKGFAIMSKGPTGKSSLRAKQEGFTRRCEAFAKKPKDQNGPRRPFTNMGQAQKPMKRPLNQMDIICPRKCPYQKGIHVNSPANIKP